MGDKQEQETHRLAEEITGFNPETLGSFLGDWFVGSPNHELFLRQDGLEGPRRWTSVSHDNSVAEKKSRQNEETLHFELENLNREQCHICGIHLFGKGREVVGLYRMWLCISCWTNKQLTSNVQWLRSKLDESDESFRLAVTTCRTCGGSQAHEWRRAYAGGANCRRCDLYLKQGGVMDGIRRNLRPSRGHTRAMPKNFFVDAINHLKTRTTKDIRDRVRKIKL
jgi:hypothetical protein